jgi:hypothetical protein
LLQESLNRICQDTKQKFILFRKEIHQEFVSIEDRIIAAVIKAVTPAQKIDTTNDSTMTDANFNMTTAQKIPKQSALLPKKLTT